MTLRVVGAGVGRTGTMSLKLALEKLLGAPCYHMLEVFPRPEHITTWHEAMRGEDVNWNEFLTGFDATVDWPACTFWKELSQANPDALILLSTRDPEAWWKSCDQTIWNVFRGAREGTPNEWMEMGKLMIETHFGADVGDKDSCIAAFERHNADVRAIADPKRLVEWQPGDGWGPLCDALDVPMPDEPFPHANTTEEFRTRAGWD